MLSRIIQPRVVLFSWNSTRMDSGEFQWDGYDNPTAYLRKVVRAQGVADWWSIGRRRSVTEDGVAMLVRTGTRDGGIVLSGLVVNGTGKATDDGTNQVKLRWNRGIDWSLHSPLQLNRIFKEHQARHIGHCLQQSGYLLEGPPAIRLLSAWQQYLRWHQRDSHGLALRVSGLPKVSEVFLEGNVSQVVIQRRERSEKVRQKLLRQGVRCAACRVSPSKGSPIDAHRAFEVHHLEAIACGPRYTSLSDVCLLCCNCHRLCHSTSPPIALDCLKRLKWLRYPRHSDR